jgi:hypothetical protein
VLTDTVIPHKYKELIGLAVSGATRWCGVVVGEDALEQRDRFGRRPRIIPHRVHGHSGRGDERRELLARGSELEDGVARPLDLHSGVTYADVMPPSTTKAAALTNDDSSLARKSAALTISRGLPRRPVGQWICLRANAAWSSP